ncbi:sensor histidine kinase [Promicromonospora iranensis]|uniref:histidine kinase n=1 Tax=Promicromonospora iranensis TaxID=1105144 RepID=A0ABU2CW80_9MICO|nr:histidine kinase [Promicromonospora iranensis]MDR7385610.1 signal transduction histidine kinase [Promicromonospora iranensis]
MSAWPLSPTRTASTAEIVAAGVCGALAIGSLLALPLLAAAEPDEGIVAVSPADAAWWIVAALILVEAVALLWARRASGKVLVAVALVPLVHAIAVPGATFSLTTIAVSFGVCWAVLREPLRRLRVVLPVVVLLVAGSQTINDVRSGAALDIATITAASLQALAVVGIPLAIGLVLAARKDARVARGKELLALKREGDALIQAAVSRERMAMSRELHDIAAHHMSGIALLASAIYRQVDADPEAAKLAAQQVRAQSTTVLDDLRRVIGLLRDESESSRSVETLAAVHELVELRRSAGTEVELVLFTAEHELGAGVGPLGQLVAYRMVQESLANAAAHAPGANCVVEIDDRDPAHLSVLVQNDGAHAPDLGPGGGFGLIGMRERAELVAAELHHGPTQDGGWEVHLMLARDTTIEDLAEEPT